MDFQCACGSKFNDLEALTTHVQKYGHAHRCSTCCKFFKSKDQLLAHRKEAGHEQSAVSLKSKQATIRQHPCTCGRRFKTLQDLRSHRKDVQHVGSASKRPSTVVTQPPPGPVPATCLICNKRCANADGLKAHKADVHTCCPTCKQYFRSVDSCSQHQRAAGHCYCREHEKAFRDTTSYKLHIRAAPHITGFECIDCNRSLKSQVALDDHLASPGHASVLLAAQNAGEAARKALEDEATKMRCEQCNRAFKTIQAYQQHKQSLKHKPLSQLICPVSSECKKAFTSPSGLLSHLESGGCKSGMNRLKLNALVHQYDTGRQITSNENVVQVMATASAAGVPPTTAGIASLASLSLSTPQGNAETCSTFSGVLVEAGDFSDTESIDSSGVLTFSRISTLSQSSCSLLDGDGADTLSEWSFLDIDDNSSATATAPPTSDSNSLPSREIHYNHQTNAWPCIIKNCTKSFKERTFLTQHLYSPFHAPKLFRCPTTSLLTTRKSGEEHEREFKTLSGFAMHLESGKCVGKGGGGEGVLREIVGMFERRIREVMGREVKLLM